MARKKRSRKKGGHRKARKPTGKAALSAKRGHKPVALLETYHDKMAKNIVKLEKVIQRRRAAGE